jgi:hypothetical protein
MLDEVSFWTPLLVQRLHRLRPTLCRSTMVDFILGTFELNPYLCQSVDEYLPRLDKYGEET